MKVIQIQVFLPSETTELERQAIIDKLYKSGALEGCQTVLSSESSFYAQVQANDDARKYRAIKAALA